MGVKQLRTNLVRPLTGVADEIAQQFQSVGFWKTILKLTGTACLTLALISILTINLINSNYYSPKLANAVSTNTATIANTTNASNVSAVSLSSTSASASSSSPYVSLSLSSATGSSDPSNGSNIAIQVPDAGGLATGSHTLTIKTNAIKGYNVTLSSNSEQTGLVNKKDSITTTIPTITTNGTLANNTWGYSLTKPSDNNSPYIGIKPKSSPDTILESNSPTGTDQATDIGKQQAIYYGVNVPDLNTVKAGVYEAEVVYTATAQLPPAPTIAGISPSTINTGNTPASDRQITITGTNLESTYEVYIDLNKDSKRAEDGSEDCTSSTVTDATITCIAPVSSTAGNHKLHMLAQGGEAAYDITYEQTVDGFMGITYMQDMTSNLCNQASTWEENKTTYRLIDNRDNTKYLIRKLADGNCWMVENLALGSTGTITLTNQNTDLHSQTNFTLPAFSSVGTSWSYNDNTPHAIQGSTTASSS